MLHGVTETPVESDLFSSVQSNYLKHLLYMKIKVITIVTQTVNCKHLFNFSSAPSKYSTSTLILHSSVACAHNLTIQWMITMGASGKLTFVFSPDEWSDDYGYTGELFKTSHFHLIVCAVAQCSEIRSCLVV